MKKVFIITVFAAILYGLTGCGNRAEKQIAKVYKQAEKEMVKASSNDEIDHINDKVRSDVTHILLDNMDKLPEILVSEKVHEAYNKYWDAVENTEGSHWMFVSAPRPVYIARDFKENTIE